MSGTGGMAPLPLRLGVIDNSGITADDHARICADLVAACRTVPLMRMRVTLIASGFSVTAFRSVYSQPVVEQYLGTSFYFASPVTRSDFDGQSVQSATCEGNDSDVLCYEVSSSSPLNSSPISVRRISAGGVGYVVIVGLSVGGSVDITAWGSDLDYRTIASFGGSLDKRDCRTEVVPYAWTAYRMIQDARGSAYSKETTGLVHVENQALARAHAARWRDAERLSTNANPATAYEKSEEWRQTLAVRLRPNDTQETIRQRCGARFLAARGATRQTIDDAVSALLGPLFVRTWRLYGDDLATPPTNTYWPVINPGTSSYDLGGGAWYSERSHLVVEVKQPSDVSSTEFLDKMDQLYELLDLRLPAWATFDWGVNVVDGFTLDVDQLDFGALGEV